MKASNADMLDLAVTHLQTLFDSGLTHVLDEKRTDFSRNGVPEGEIVDFLEEVLQKEPINVGYTSAGPYSDYSINGKLYRVAYGANDYIVSFYPI